MSEEVQRELIPLRLGNDERILVTCTTTWPGDEGPRLEDVPIWEIPNSMVAFNTDGRVIDIARGDRKPVKWWQVVAHCRANGRNHVPIYFDGAGSEAPAELLEKAPYVALRRASEGPWLLVRFPGWDAEKKEKQN